MLKEQYCIGTWNVRSMNQGKFMSRAVPGRSHPAPKARGSSREEQPHILGTVAARAQEGLEELPTLKVRKGSGEEIPFVQGKEQWLCFAGAAVKRYPMPKVRETQVRW